MISIGPESMLTCGVNPTTSIDTYILICGAGYGATVVKLQTSPFVVIGGLNSSTRQ
jgi:hypothetical protein